MTMSEFLGCTKGMQATDVKCFQLPKMPDTTEIHLQLSLARTLLYFGEAVLSEECIDASKIQKRLDLLYMSEIMDANCMIRGLLCLERKLLIPKVNTSNPLE